MNLLDRIKAFFNRKNQKQIEAPQVGQKSSIKDSVIVDKENLELAKKEQEKEKQREFQLMFTVKNVCGNSINLNGMDLKNAIKSTLEKYGYESDELYLDELDVDILSKINMNLNINSSEKLSEYINNSNNPPKDIATLINTVKANAINKAKEFGYNEKMANSFLSTNIVSQIENIIDEQNIQQINEHEQ